MFARAFTKEIFIANSVFDGVFNDKLRALRNRCRRHQHVPALRTDDQADILYLGLIVPCCSPVSGRENFLRQAGAVLCHLPADDDDAIGSTNRLTACCSPAQQLLIPNYEMIQAAPHSARETFATIRKCAQVPCFSPRSLCDRNIAEAISIATASTKDKSASPVTDGGVPTVMKTASAFSTASVTQVSSRLSTAIFF